MCVCGWGGGGGEGGVWEGGIHTHHTSDLKERNNFLDSRQVNRLKEENKSTKRKEKLNRNGR